MLYKLCTDTVNMETHSTFTQLTRSHSVLTQSTGGVSLLIDSACVREYKPT